MWRKVLTPTLLVISVWIVVGGATTFYIDWLARLHVRVLDENVGTIQAVAVMQDSLLRLQALTASDRGSQLPRGAFRVEQLLSDFERGLAAADDTAVTPEERALVAALQQEFSDYCVREWGVWQRALGRPPEAPGPLASASVENMTSSLSRLREINERLMSRSVTISQFYLALHPLRLVLMVLGTVLGIACGVWIARGFRRSISRISVTLSSTTSGESQPLGLVTVTPVDDLPALQQQVEAVGQRIRHVLDQLQQTQRQLVRSDQLAVVGQLAAGVAHELRNPLTSVKLLIQTAARPGPKAGLNEEQLWVIQEEIARMENTIQGLLDFARPPLLDRVRHDLRDTVQRAVSLVEGRAKQQQVAIRVQLPEAPVMVDGDPAQIHQVFVNLLLNGMDAAGRGGVLQVVVSRSETPGGPCRISFRDSGKGIPEDTVPRLFEPFVTTKEQGIGLGLAISRRIVEEHGGAIRVANREEGGAEFTVELSTSPAAPQPPAEPERRKADGF